MGGSRPGSGRLAAPLSTDAAKQLPADDDDDGERMKAAGPVEAWGEVTQAEALPAAEEAVVDDEGEQGRKDKKEKKDKKVKKKDGKEGEDVEDVEVKKEMEKKEKEKAKEKDKDKDKDKEKDKEK